MQVARAFLILASSSLFHCLLTTPPHPSQSAKRRPTLIFVRALHFSHGSVTSLSVGMMCSSFSGLAVVVAFPAGEERKGLSGLSEENAKK